MGILSRPKLSPQQRWDLEDYNAALSALRADSHYYTQNFWAKQSYILEGFVISGTYIGQPNASITMTGSTLINGNNTGDFSWWTAPAAAAPLPIPTGVGGLQAGRNYVELNMYAQDGTPLQRAFWDPSANSGAGLEFTQEVNTITELFVQVVVSQSGFSGNPNNLQLAIVDLDNSLNIKGIKDKRNLFFRLGQPNNINYTFPWATRAEPPTTLIFNFASGTPFAAEEEVTFTSGATATVQTGGNNNVQVFGFSNDNIASGDTVTGTLSGATATLQSYYEAFNGSDKDIQTLRDMFVAIMSEIRVLKGTSFWYELSSITSLTSLLNFIQCILVPISNGARFSWTGTTLSITDDATSGQTSADVMGAIRIPGFTNNIYLSRQDGTGGTAPLSLPDKNILFVELPTPGVDIQYSGQGSGATNYRITPIGSFTPSDKNYVVAYREGNIVRLPNGDLHPGEDLPIGGDVPKELLAFIGSPSETTTNPPYTTTPSSDLANQFTTQDSLTQSTSINAANINDIASAILNPYQEVLTLVSGSPANSNQATGPISASGTLTLPLDSRHASAVKSYVVGMGSLLVTLNGILMAPGLDYTEIGSTGSLSSTITTLINLVVGDQIDFLLPTPQYFGSAATAQPYFVEYITGQNGPDVPVGHLYNIGTDKLTVYRNGLNMVRTSSIGPVNDRYQENGSNAIAVPFTPNPSEVFIMVNYPDPAPGVTLQTGLTVTVISVPTYTIGNGSLMLFRNGLLMSAGAGAPSAAAYTETSTSTVTLGLTASTPDVFRAHRMGTAPTWRKTLTTTTGAVLTIPGGMTYTIGNKRLLVYRNGLLMNNSMVLGNAASQYQETSTTQITLQTAAITADFFEFIYV